MINENEKYDSDIKSSEIMLPGTILPEDFITIPTEITVHLGAPDEDAENVTVPFIDYIKNVGSSELYPTWPENAIRANIHAIVSVALNRIFTEWYRSRGYNFNITNSTVYDQAYVHNRGFFDSISNIVDDIFNQYIVRSGEIQPIYAQFCDGRISQCDGMYQWGTVDLANEGYTPIEILRYYYGDDIEIITDAPFSDIQNTYPGEPLKLGDSGINVYRFQHSLDRISNNYPGIPRISPLNGEFNESTEAAVREFQSVFNLPVTGIVGQGTWYAIRRIYIAVTKLGELSSEGLLISELEDIYSQIIYEGDTRPGVPILQYFLNVLSAYYDTIPAVPITGMFDSDTRTGVIEFQKTMNLPETGIVNQETWDILFSTVLGILETIPPEAVFLPRLRYPGIEYYEGIEGQYAGVVIIQEMLLYISIAVPQIPPVEINGVYDEATAAAVTEFQNLVGLEPTGIVDENTWSMLEDIYRSQRFSGVRTPGQYSGVI
ncbi:peptidoglycan-binding protein [Sedimentibacter sp. MB31-C6]|uniref:peptidoglycan-binding protein n=1 Tax=Sedimentibacter sp. MB31-C6 TaxID=3109366 RepID=UPI002DDD46CE|nr:peptidoglycan-binding protein [Sedimentibacter sp. MB36-C1]WSI03784.1 peptidoglycan-binding protein [Sedimentibacter sp. MB36-C1]